MDMMEITDEQRAWIKTRRKRRLRVLAAVLCLSVLFTTYPNILEAFSVFAAENGAEENILYVSGFSDLPEGVREQTVPVGTGLEELTLPDTLEATVQTGQNAADQDEDADHRETEDADEGTEKPSDGEEDGEGTGKPSDEEDGGETEDPSGEGENGEDTGDPSDEETADAENPFDGEENGEDTEKPSDGEENGEDTETLSGEEENGEDTEAPSDEGATGTEDQDGSAENPDGDGQDGAEQEPYTVTLPEYQSEHVITVKQLEDSSVKNHETENIDGQADDTDVVTITGVTWQSEPVYDGNTAGTYIFTAILPGGGICFRKVSACHRLR